jgi:predicted NBD/HSP70 family sugar kinase
MMTTGIGGGLVVNAKHFHGFSADASGSGLDGEAANAVSV